MNFEIIGGRFSLVSMSIIPGLYWNVSGGVSCCSPISSRSSMSGIVDGVSRVYMCGS